MTKNEAWRVIDACRHWNTGQKSPSYAFGGPRTAEDDVLDEKRATLLEAWRVVRTDATEPVPPNA